MLGLSLVPKLSNAHFIHGGSGVVLVRRELGDSARFSCFQQISGERVGRVGSELRESLAAFHEVSRGSSSRVRGTSVVRFHSDRWIACASAVAEAVTVAIMRDDRPRG